jgi:hypothetical protein
MTSRPPEGPRTSTREGKSCEKDRLPCIATLALLLGAAGSANARTLGSTTLGSSTGNCFSSEVIVQSTSDPSTPYASPAAGKITQWATAMTAADESKSLTLVVVRANSSTHDRNVHLAKPNLRAARRHAGPITPHRRH